MESQYAMKITKQNYRKGFAMIEVMLVLTISLWSIILIVPFYTQSNIHIIDSQVFSSMMRAIHMNSLQPILVNGIEINGYHPNHAFSKSTTVYIENIQITFFIGRGYYAIKKRP
jgi:prepilin-type N-terminal cleavage/methylation domain-containing protein